MTDEELIAGVLARAPVAWRELLERHGPPAIARIRRYCLGAPEADVDDAFGAFCLQLLEDNMRRLRAWDPARGVPLGAWLCMLAGHAARDRFRASAPAAIERPLDELDQVDDGPGPLDGILERERRREAQRRIGQLTVKERRLVELRARGATTREIADALGVAMNTVGAKWFKARAKLNRRRGL